MSIADVADFSPSTFNPLIPKLSELIDFIVTEILFSLVESAPTCKLKERGLAIPSFENDAVLSVAIVALTLTSLPIS